MIATTVEYRTAQGELRSLEARLPRLQESHPEGSHPEESHPAGAKGFTKAGVRKMIARLHEELAVYEGSEAARHPEAR